MKKHGPPSSFFFILSPSLEILRSLSHLSSLQYPNITKTQPFIHHSCIPKKCSDIMSSPPSKDVQPEGASTVLDDECKGHNMHSQEPDHDQRHGHVSATVPGILQLSQCYRCHRSSCHCYCRFCGKHGRYMRWVSRAFKNHLMRANVYTQTSSPCSYQAANTS